MRFIDKTGCKSAFEKGADKEIESLGKLTKKACKIAKENKLGVLKTRQLTRISSQTLQRLTNFSRTWMHTRQQSTKKGGKQNEKRMA